MYNEDQVTIVQSTTELERVTIGNAGARQSGATGEPTRRAAAYVAAAHVRFAEAEAKFSPK